MDRFMPEDERRRRAEERTGAPGGGYRFGPGKVAAAEPIRRIPVGKAVRAPAGDLKEAAEKAGTYAAARASGRQLSERLAEERQLEGQMRGFALRHERAKAKAEKASGKAR